MKLKIQVLFLLVMVSVFQISASDTADASFINLPDSPVQVFAELEQGVVKVLSHTYQSGETGTNFNYVTQGGQEILFPFTRAKAGLVIADRHMLTALYQPLTVETDVTFREDVSINGVTFPAGTAMELKYGFPFWRFTYGFDFFKADNLDLYGGLALQLRNASIVFAQADGEQATSSQNLGPVPAIFLAAKYSFPSGISVGMEATGLYASSAYINGADFTFEGSILDASVRASVPLSKGLDTFVNLRFLGGTAVGVSEYEDRFWTQAIEDYTSNKLATLTLTAGLTIR